MPIPAQPSPQVHYIYDPTRTLSSNGAYSHSGLDLGSYFLPGLSTAGISTTPFLNDPYDRNGRYSAMDHPLSPTAIDHFAPPVHPVIHPQPADSSFRPSKFQVEPGYRQLVITHPEPCQTVAMKQYVLTFYVFAPRSIKCVIQANTAIELENASRITRTTDSSPSSGNPGMSTGLQNHKVDALPNSLACHFLLVLSLLRHQASVPH